MICKKCSAMASCMHIMNQGGCSVIICSKCMHREADKIRRHMFGLAIVSPFGGYCPPVHYHSIVDAERIDLEPYLTFGSQIDPPVPPLPGQQNVEKLWPELFATSDALYN